MEDSDADIPTNPSPTPLPPASAGVSAPELLQVEPSQGPAAAPVKPLALFSGPTSLSSPPLPGNWPSCYGVWGLSQPSPQLSEPRQAACSWPILSPHMGRVGELSLRRQGRLWRRLASVSLFVPGGLSSSGLGVMLSDTPPNLGHGHPPSPHPATGAGLCANPWPCQVDKAGPASWFLF